MNRDHISLVLLKLKLIAPVDNSHTEIDDYLVEKNDTEE